MDIAITTIIEKAKAPSMRELSSRTATRLREFITMRFTEKNSLRPRYRSATSLREGGYLIGADEYIPLLG